MKTTAQATLMAALLLFLEINLIRPAARFIPLSMWLDGCENSVTWHMEPPVGRLK